MLTFAFMHHPYLVCILFGMPSLHPSTFLMFIIFLYKLGKVATYVILLRLYGEFLRHTSVADSGGVRGVQMHPPLAASNVFLRT